MSSKLATFSTLAIALFTIPSAFAAPVNQERDYGYITATLIGAANAEYTIQIPLDSQFHPTNNALSISHINTDGGPCGFFGIDGLLYTAPEAGYGDVGPPQTIVGVACGPVPEH